MVVQHNLASMNANRMLNTTSKKQAKASEKLSSGYRINRAADDAAGLSISEKMRKQVRGLSQGVENTEAGISLCQVMDGALHEVTAMAQRISELAIQAANGTNSSADREAIQNEIDQLICEINRVGETTKFNEVYPFKGGVEHVTYAQSVETVPEMDVEVDNDIPFSDFKLADVSLGLEPFAANSSPDHLALQAIVDNPDSSFHGKTYDMIYGKGSTSHSSFKLSYHNQTSDAPITLESLDPPKQYGCDQVNNTWTRTYNYTNADGVNIDITQKVKVVDTSDSEKNYEISYEFKNNNPSVNVTVEFMFHADTAYNNNDYCEGYFMDGKRIENNCVYTQEYSSLTFDQTSEYIYEGAKVPDSFSVVDVDDTLAFSEKISFSGTGNNRPYSLSIGHYDLIHNWNYYKDLSNVLGTSTNKEDLGFSLYYAGAIGAGDQLKDTVTFSFNYGIVAAEKDTNLTGVKTSHDKEPATLIELSRVIEDSLWIQSGAEAMDGMRITMRPVNAEVLGLKDVNVCTEKGADRAIDLAGEAIKQISAHRSIIGAQQNRLEHTIANENNIIENTTAAESRIRDTDMAEVMLGFSQANVLAQAGQAMLAQANQSTQGVLSLLQ